MFHLVALIFAFGLALLATFGVPENAHFKYLGASLAFYYLSVLLAAYKY